MSRALSVVLGSTAMLSFLLAVASLSFGRIDGLVFYLAAAVVSSFAVARLMRADIRRRRAAGELPATRVPRRPVTFPIRETALTFAAWYAMVVVIERVATGLTNVFTLIAIAPFAAFMLAALTIAGRHMAFRLTAEEEDRS